MENKITTPDTHRGQRKEHFTIQHPAGLLRFFPLGTPPRMKFFALSGGQTTCLGRSEECEITLQDDKVSRQHATITKLDETWQIVDNGSMNGVRVNGESTKRMQLEDGAIVRIGDTLFRFFLHGTAAYDFTHHVETNGFIAGPALEKMLRVMKKAAQSDLTVLITGPTGTGKEVAARYIFTQAANHRRVFIPVNCSAIPHSVFESEMFGYKKGAFTGASADKQGFFQQANHGILFLDEIGELSLDNQAKLLRALQEHAVQALGATSLDKLELQVICATNKKLPNAVERGEFRADLYARISDLIIQLPELNQRIEDIALLVQHFIKKYQSKVEINTKTIEYLCCQNWPLNIRQLETSVKRALLLSEGNCLDPEAFSADSALGLDEIANQPLTDDCCENQSAPRHVAENKQEIERQDLIAVLRRCKGDVELAAQDLKISRSQLYRRAKKYGIKIVLFRD